MNAGARSDEHPLRNLARYRATRFLVDPHVAEERDPDGAELLVHVIRDADTLQHRLYSL